MISVLAFFLFALACKKDNDSPSTKREMLTAHMLIYDELSQLPNRNIIYKKGASGNTINFDRQRVHYYQDGTYDEFTVQGTFITGNWEFLNNETQVRVFGAGYSNIGTIVTLTEDKFEWHDDVNKTYGIQISKK